jgi:hypothetical protein
VRLACLLLLAAAVGFVVGRLTAPEIGGVRGQRAAVALPPPAAPPPPSEPAPRAPEARPATPGVVQPAGPIEVDEDEQIDSVDGEPGLIEVDFAGFDGEAQAWIGWRGIRGGYEAWNESLDDGETVAFFELAPETYDVWWLGPDGRRRGTRAAVEAGQRTRIRASDYPHAAPVPEGLGILEVEVAATWGGGLACELNLFRAESLDYLQTNVRGHGSIVLFPGRYTLAIGDYWDEVTVAEGCVTSHRIAHRKEGDLILDGAWEGDLEIVHAGEPLPPTKEREDWTGLVRGDPRRGFVYLAEGEYDIHIVRDNLDELGVAIGRATVNAGRTTFQRYELPKGGLALRVTRPALETLSGVAPDVLDDVDGISVSIRRIVDGALSDRRMSLSGSNRSRAASFTVVLAPGRYLVAAEAEHCEPQSVEVDVADRMVELSLELTQRR